MDIQQMRYFSTLATTGNFTRAATELHLTQSALSKSIAALETELGVPLFYRSTKGATLSAAGKEFFRFVSHTLKEYERCTLNIRELSEPFQHVVNLACTLPEVFVRVLEHFHSAYPQVQVRLPSSDSMTAEELLLTGQLDFIISSTPIAHPSVEWIPVMRDEFFLSVPPVFPYVQWQEINLLEFQNEPFIMPQSGSEVREQLELFCTQAGFTPHVAFEVTEEAASRKLVQIGYGVAFVSSLSIHNTTGAKPAQDKQPEGPVQVQSLFLRIQKPLCYRTIGFCRVKNRPLSGSANYLYACFQQYLARAHEQIAMQFPIPENGNSVSD